MSVSESRQGARQDNVASEARQLTKADYTELPAPKEATQKSSLKQRSEIVS